jgi:hypothetical protein
MGLSAKAPYFATRSRRVTALPHSRSSNGSRGVGSRGMARRFRGAAAPRPRGSFEVMAAGESRTRFVSHYQPELTGTMALLRPILKRSFRKQRAADTEHLKQLLEANAAR